MQKIIRHWWNQRWHKQMERYTMFLEESVLWKWLYYLKKSQKVLFQWSPGGCEKQPIMWMQEVGNRVLVVSGMEKVLYTSETGHTVHGMRGRKESRPNATFLGLSRWVSGGDGHSPGQLDRGTPWLSVVCSLVPLEMVLRTWFLDSLINRNW